MDVNKLNVKSNSAGDKSIKFCVTLMGIKPIYFVSRQKKSFLNLLGLIPSLHSQSLNSLSMKNLRGVLDHMSYSHIKMEECL
jgi:hypothetical protein